MVLTHGVGLLSLHLYPRFPTTSKLRSGVSASRFVLLFLFKKPEESKRHSMEKNLMIEPSIAQMLPMMVKTELSKLDETSQANFVEEFNRKKKSLGWAYFFLLVCFGMPYGYLHKWGLQVVYWVTIAGLGVWFIILLFKLPSMVEEYNRDVALEILRNMKIMQMS